MLVYNWLSLMSFQQVLSHTTMLNDHNSVPGLPLTSTKSMATVLMN